MNRRYAIIEAPSVLGLRPTGVETLPDALLRAGLATRLRARRARRIEPPPYDDRRDPETLEIILQTALDSPRAVGLEITIFNPHLDPDGRIARSLVETLVRSLTR